MKHLLITLIIGVSIISFSMAGIIHVPGDQPTIQAGINAAVNLDTVLVADGLYYENINFKGKAITVASTFLINQDTSHISNTTINGAFPAHPDSGSVVYFISGEDTNSVLCGFTVTGGGGTWGVYSLSSGRSGGGIMIDRSGAKIIHNIIEDNVNLSTVPNSYAWGGGVDAYPDTLNFSIIIENNIIRNNRAEADLTATGGGMSIWLYENAQILNNTVTNNSCLGQNGYSFGGGIYCESRPADPKTMTIAGNIFSDNTAIGNNSGGQGGCGGGIAIYGIKGRILNNIITDNRVSATPGNYGYGAGLWILGGDSSLVSSNVISGNSFENGFCRGGGIQVQENSVHLINNLIYDNHATFGGGFRIYNSLGDQTFTDEMTEHQNPGFSRGISNKNLTTVLHKTNSRGRQPHLINNTFTNNTAIASGGGLYVASSNLIVMNTILWDNTAPSGKEIYKTVAGTLQVVYSDVEGSWPGISNKDDDPLFEDTLLFHLTDPSPCIGAGIDTFQFSGVWYFCPNCDCEGGLRPNPPGSMPDMGAWESPLPTGLSHTKDIISSTYNLYQNYPNPFNPMTNIRFDLPKASKVSLIIYNILGEELTTLHSGQLLCGSYEYEWDASNLASGVYLYRLRAGDYVMVKKMVLMR